MHGFRRPLGLFLYGGVLRGWQAAALQALSREGLSFDEMLGLWDAPIMARKLTLAPLRGCRDIILLEPVAAPARRRRGAPGRLGRFGRGRLTLLIDEAVRSLRTLPDPPRVFRLRPQWLERGAEDARLFLAQTSTFLAS